MDAIAREFLEHAILRQLRALVAPPPSRGGPLGGGDLNYLFCTPPR
jgi:hypothetical protein